MARILFIQDMLIEYFGIEMLSAMLKKHGHESDGLVTNMEKKKHLIQKIKRYNPDVVAFTIMSGGFEWSVKLAEQIKKELGIPNIFGGPHPTFFPNFINTPHVDNICMGEGEEAIVDFANAIEKGSDTTKIPNIWAKKGDKIFKNNIRPLVENLDELPFPDRDIYYNKYRLLESFPSKRFMSDRGCPYNCTFCFNHKLRAMYKDKGTYMRIRSPRNMIDEILQVKEKYPLKFISYTNDSFTWNKKWLVEYLDLYKKEVDLPFSVQCRVNELDEEIVKKLKWAGLDSARFGIEAGSERVRRDILNRHMTNEQIIEGARLLKKYKIKILTFNMHGLPTETLDEAFQTLNLNIKIKTDIPSSTIFQPLPGTRIYEMVKEKGLFKKSYNPKDPNKHYGVSSLNQKDIDKITNLERLFYMGVKFPSTVPLIKKLINYNGFRPLFKVVLGLGMFHKYVTTLQANPLTIMRLAWKMRQQFAD